MFSLTTRLGTRRPLVFPKPYKGHSRFCEILSINQMVQNYIKKTVVTPEWVFQLLTDHNIFFDGETHSSAARIPVRMPASRFISGSMSIPSLLRAPGLIQGLVNKPVIVSSGLCIVLSHSPFRNRLVRCVWPLP